MKEKEKQKKWERNARSQIGKPTTIYADKVHRSKRKTKYMHINEQKERRQKNLIDKRAENSKREKEEKKDKNPNNQLMTMIKEITKSLTEFEQATRKEIDNIMEIVKLKFNKMGKEQEKLLKITQEFEIKYESAKRLISEPEGILYRTIYSKTDANIKNSFIHD